MPEIQLTCGQVAICDPEDFKELSRYRWSATKVFGSKVFYPARIVTHPDGSTKWVTMPTMFLDVPLGHQVIYRNGNPCDVRRANLITGTRSQQTVFGFWAGRRGKKRGSRGVTYCKRKRVRPWQAYIDTDGRKQFLGYFDSEDEAKRARDRAAIKYHGQWATLNFPLADYANGKA